MNPNENEKIEIDLLLEAIYRKYGYDFRGYANASIRRRIMQRLQRSGLETVSLMTHKVLYEPTFFETLLADLTVNVTEMFRDPLFFKTLKETVIPQLPRDSFIKIWHAGCSSGEEVYSMAILLLEAGLDKNIRIYATDANEDVLARAKKGIYPIKNMKEYSRNYIHAGGCASLSDYYTARYDNVIMANHLKDNILFSLHNLVTDSVFGEMNLIVCRNVLIYFNRPLQDQVLALFNNSLCPGGYLCLGTKETVRFSIHSDCFETLADKERIYQKRVTQTPYADTETSGG